MELGPGKDKTELSVSETAVDDLKVVDPDLSLAVSVVGVKVGMAVVVKVHRDRDSEEAADCRHALLRRGQQKLSPSGNLSGDVV